MAPDRAPKAVSPPTADQRQNDVPGGSGWSEMEEGVMRNKIQLVVSPIFGENPGGTKRNSRGFSSFDRRRSGWFSVARMAGERRPASKL
ncbi:hypothetical protein CUMW_161560 [Citrus unshiu]|uniref:Uncharacterized protein n=1 Tax=Citrus unshiu TaxID=55188 RepID=A0A2H5PRS0_CITUN|nr:hypothetical protein CUMW_161560 [Citrus unshiu]